MNPEQGLVVLGLFHLAMNGDEGQAAFDMFIDAAVDLATEVSFLPSPDCPHHAEPGEVWVTRAKWGYDEEDDLFLYEQTLVSSTIAGAQDAARALIGEVSGEPFTADWEWTGNGTGGFYCQDVCHWGDQECIAFSFEKVSVDAGFGV